MDTNQPASSATIFVPPPAKPGMFGTKIPSTVAFAFGILLFFLPFSELRCVSTKVATKSGLDFSLGNDWKPITGGAGVSKTDFQKKASSFGKEQKGNTQYLAIGAAALALLGLLLSLSNSRSAWGGGIITGVLSGGALIGLMLDEKKNYAALLKNQALDKVKEGADNFGFNNLGDNLGDTKLTLAFSPWFYIAVIAFLAAAFFCYKRMQSSKT